MTSEVICTNCGATNRDSAKFCSECGTTLPLSGESTKKVQALKPGQMLQSRYRIDKELGRGGFGAVYMAWDNNLSRSCAVKENLQISEDAQRQFTREATVLANLSHPNLPRVIDHFVIPEQGQYLVMDFVEGEDLASLAEREATVPLEQALKWIAQVADALAYLHAREIPIYHRDIKPANIRITPKGQAMLVDFGLVKISEPHAQTTVGARAITPGYAPPEQYGRGSTDARTDIYALAATLYRLLSGHEPPESVQRMSGALIQPVTQLNPRIPPYISKVIDHAMAIDPRQRYQNAAEFKNALTEGHTVMVQGPSAQESRVAAAGIPRTVVADAGQLPRAQAFPQSREQRRERPDRQDSGRLLMIGGGAIVAILFVMAALGLGGWLVISNQMSARATEQAGSTATAVAQVQATSTQEVAATMTSQANMTQTAAPIVTATARAEGTATAEAQATLDFLSQRNLIYGPTSGTLVHDKSDTDIEFVEAAVDVRNFEVEVRFFNPYPLDRGAWAHGLVLNDVDDNQIRCVFGSDIFWECDLFPPGDAEQQSIDDGNFAGILTDAGESNLFRIVQRDGTGTLYINDQFVAEMDFSVLTTLQTVWAATGMYGDPVTEYEGETTQYSDFSIWALP